MRLKTSDPAPRREAALRSELFELFIRVFSGHGDTRAARFRQFLRTTNVWSQLDLALPAPPCSWGQLLEAAVASLVGKRLLDDGFFDELAHESPAQREQIGHVRLLALYPERLPPTWESFGPEGGAIERIAVDPFVPTSLLCCVHINASDNRVLQLHRSSDRGATWSPIAPALDGILIRWIAFDPHHAGTIKLATEKGLWTSRDNGDTWELDAEDQAARYPVSAWQIRFHPTREEVHCLTNGRRYDVGAGAGSSSIGVLSVETPRPVARREGRVQDWFQIFDPVAKTWESVLLPEPQTAACFSRADWRKLWVTCDDGLFSSTDQGRSWTTVPAPAKGHVWDIWLDPADERRLLLATDRGMILSEDGGQSFSPTGEPGTVREIVECNDGLCVPTADGVWHSADSGRSWQRVGDGLPPVRCWSLAVGPDGTLYAGMDSTAGVFRLDPGSQVWLSRSSGLLPQPIQACSGTTYLCNELLAYRRSPTGSDWEPIGPGGTSIAAAGEAIALGGLSQLRITKDGGATWTRIPVDGGYVFQTIGHDGSLWARWTKHDKGRFLRLAADASWVDDSPCADRATTDVVLDGQRWIAIDPTGQLYERPSSESPWREVSPSPLVVGPATWRLARTALGWFAWRTECGLAYSRDLGGRWDEITLPETCTAVGGVAGDPLGRDVVWLVSKERRLFALRFDGARWELTEAAPPWLRGRCLGLFGTNDGALIAYGTGGAWRFPSGRWSAETLKTPDRPAG
jgi:photosystem II stability/assembly factor-like uncharacterized protein